MELDNTNAYKLFMWSGYRFLLLIALCGLLQLPVPVAAIAETGFPLPRYASLRANEVYLRTGPGRRYPVDWIFISRGMPVEITAEFENWRRVRDWQGTEGWVHRSMLSGKRTIVVKGGLQPLRGKPDPNSLLTARVMEKVIGHILECEGDWCRLEVRERRGWMRRAHIWGVYSDEILK